MKKCWRCAEEIQIEAAVCRFCGAKQARPPTSGANNKIVGFAVLAVAIVIVALGIPNSKPPESAPTAGPRAIAGLTDEQRAVCRKGLKLMTEAGLIRKLARNRIDVDDVNWAALPADEKRTLLAFVGCVAFDKPQDEWAELEEYTVAYGYLSGKRLAMATSVATNFE